MTYYQTTPLATPSDYAARYTQDGSLGATREGVVLGVLMQASQHITTLAQRRFDYYYGTRYYTPRALVNGGDLEAPRTLLVSDLQALVSVANGDGTAIDVANVTPLPKAGPPYHKLRLNIATHWLYDIDPEDAVEVVGWWGYGGSWQTLTATVTTDSGTTLTPSAVTEFKAGQLVRLEDELVMVDAVGDTDLTVQRAYNGTSQVSHDGGTAISLFHPNDSIKTVCLRLARWRLAQDDSPLVGTAVVGDIELPFDVGSIPSDITEQVQRYQLPDRIWAA